MGDYIDNLSDTIEFILFALHHYNAVIYAILLF